MIDYLASNPMALPLTGDDSNWVYSNDRRRVKPDTEIFVLILSRATAEVVRGRFLGNGCGMNRINRYYGQWQSLGRPVEFVRSEDLFLDESSAWRAVTDYFARAASRASALAETTTKERP